jgi:hypothetical protein
MTRIRFYRPVLMTLIGATVMASTLMACGGSGEGKPAAQQASAVPTRAGSGAQVSKGSKAPDPCSLLSEAEAAAATGEPVRAEEKAGGPNPLGQRICWYGAVAETSFGFVQISVVHNEAMDASVRKHGINVERIFKESKALHTTTSPETVTGIGDEAFLVGTRSMEIR